MGLSMAPAKPMGLHAALTQRYQQMLDDAVTTFDGSGGNLQGIIDLMAQAKAAGVELDVDRARRLAQGYKPDVTPSTSPARNGAEDTSLPFKIGKVLHDLPGNVVDWAGRAADQMGSDMEWLADQDPVGAYPAVDDFMLGITGQPADPLPLDPWAQGIVPEPFDMHAAANPLAGMPGSELVPPLPLDPWAQGIIPNNEVTLTDDARLSTTDEPDPLDIEVVPPADPAQEDIDRKSTELIQNDRDLGGEGFSENRPFAKSRAKVLDWLGHDEESGQRLGNSLMTMGGAILASDAGSWQGALGEGILAGRADYDDQKQDSIDNAAQQARLDMAQMEMEERRLDRQEKRRQEGLDRAEAAVKGKLEGFTYDENNNMTGFSAEQRRKYAGLMGPTYKPQSSIGKMEADIAAEVAELERAGIDPQTARAMVEAKYGRLGQMTKAPDPLAGIIGE